MAASDAPGLIADIGGTNVRFALADPQAEDDAQFRDVVRMKCADYPTLAAAVSRYYEQLGLTERPRLAVFAAAGPVRQGRIQLTNHVWRASLADLEAALGLTHAVAINDFEAIGHAAAVLPHSQRRAIGQVPEPDLEGGKRVYAVTGPGTGIGVALVITGLGAPVVIATEGGHVSFAPQSDKQVEIARALRRDYPRLSVERLLSGPGLVNLHRALSLINKADAPDLTPADITRLALEGDPLCRETLDEFYSILGSFSGDLVLITGAQAGLFLGGGILPPLAEDFARSRFRASFEEKGRFRDYNATIPTWLMMAPDPGLTGSAAVIHRLFHDSG